MNDDLYFKNRIAELEATAQKLKDDYIDESLRIANKFTRDWTELLTKKGQIASEQQKQDKLNVNP